MWPEQSAFSWLLHDAGHDILVSGVPDELQKVSKEVAGVPAEIRT
jgi:hypothetical protein